MRCSVNFLKIDKANNIMLLRVPDVILNKILSCLDLSDVSIVVVLCKYTKSIKSQIYESAQYAHIHNKYTVKRLVECCPKIKHVTITTSYLNADQYDLLHRLNLETIVHRAIRDSEITLRFKNLKNLDVWNISYFNVENCTELENISVRSYSSEVDLSGFAKLKSVRINDTAYLEELPPKLPFTKLNLKSTLTDEILRLPLDTLHIEVGRFINKILPILERANLKHLKIKCQLPSGRSLGAGFTREIHMPNLRTLELLYMTVRLSMLKFTNITDLSMIRCKFVCEQFKILAITKLTLEGCNIDLDSLTLRLKYLSILDCEVTGSLSQLPETLEYLEIIDSDVVIGNLSRLSKLHTLIINIVNEEDNLLITDEALISISKLPIRVLSLCGCGLNDSHMDYLADMQINDLNLESNDITMVGIRKLRRLPLRRLEVSDIPLIDMMLR